MSETEEKREYAGGTFTKKTDSETGWVTLVFSPFCSRSVRWDGTHLIVKSIKITARPFLFAHCYHVDVKHDAASLASEEPSSAYLFATEAGASDEYRIAVLKALIDATMEKRGCGTASTHFNPCAMSGIQWTAHVRSNVPREDEDLGIAGRTPYAEAQRCTELEALEALALFLGAAS